MFDLRGDIEHSVSQQEISTYAELLRECYDAETNLKKIYTEREKARKLQRNSSRVIQNLKPRGYPSKGKKVQSVGPMSPWQCIKFDKFHFGK